MSESDLAIFDSIKKGDLPTFEAFFRKHYAEVVRYSHRFVRDNLAAEEIAQEVFTYIWEKRATINIQSSLASYLFQAAKNRSINYIKLELPKIQSQTDITEIDIGLDATDSDEEKSALIGKMVKKAIDALPTKCKEIFVLSRSEGLTYDEIAEVLDLSKKTVENQMGIALKKLRERLKPVMDYVRSQ